jgi:cyclophilin family peptidyl-prolyl cis-trans isomerase
MEKNLLTKKQKEELQKLIDGIVDDAKSVLKDYKESPSEISGSVVQIHENSPFMDENYKDDKWKHVIHGTVEDGIEAVKKIKKDKKNT